nr:hypothetical protein [Tanacetum cinerariifolium]
MDVKSAFLYGTINEEVYVMQPPRYQDPEFPASVYKVEKAMYGLHQAPRAWYVYVDDIIFGSSNPQLYREFEALMHEKFQMSAMGDILKKFRYSDVRSSNTPMDKENPWGKDGTRKDVDLHLYRSMIRSLMYLTASRPDSMFAVWLWYPKESPFDLVAYSDSDYGGATQDRKSTTGGCQFLGRRFISWQCKKQTIMAPSTTEAEYVAAASGCGQVLLSMPCEALSKEISSSILLFQGEACPTDSGFIADQDRATIAKSSTLPHDSAPRVTSPAADEGSMQKNISELTALCTSLQRQYSKLMSKFQAQEEEIGRLKERVQVLEDREAVATKQSGEDAPIKGRSPNEGEAAA